MNILNMLKSMPGSEAKKATDIETKEHDRKELKLNAGTNFAQAAFDSMAQDDLTLKPSL